LRAAGFDGVVCTFDPAVEGQASACRVVAEAARFPYALEVDLRYIAGGDGAVPITPETADRARDLMNGPSFGFWDPGYHLRRDADGGYLVFLQGAGRVAPTFTEGERRHVADVLAQRLGSRATRSFDGVSEEPLWTQAPRTLDELNAPTGEGILWRDAYHRAIEEWWARAVDLDANATRIDLVLDADVDLPLGPDGHTRVVGTYSAVGSRLDDDDVRLRFESIPADPADADGYARAWSEGVRRRPAGLIVPWNDFDLGLGIEPTIEHGADLLHLTQRWAQSYRNLGPAGTEPAAGPAADVA